MRFTLDYEIKNNMDLNNLKKNAYACFCVEFINSVKDKLNFTEQKIEIDKKNKKSEENKKINVIRYSIDIPFVRTKKTHEFPVKPQRIINNKGKFNEFSKGGKK
jgi:hypothetical protein